MNNLDKIIEKILSEANAEKENISLQTSSAIDEINSKTLQEAEYLMESSAKKSEKERDLLISRTEGSAQMKKREIILREKVRLKDRVFEEAEKRLCELPAEEYCAFLANLIADAMRERLENVAEMKTLYGEDEDNDYCTTFSVVFNSRDRKEYSAEATKTAKAILKKRIAIGIEKDCADIKGGVIVRYGDIETNCSIEAVIASARNKCEAEVARIIFAQKEEPAPDKVKIIRRN